MDRYSIEETAHRAGVGRDYIEELVRLALLQPDQDGKLSDGDVRRAACIQALSRGGVPVEALATGVASGSASLGFLDDPVYERIAATTDETFAELAGRTGISIEMLTVVREAFGWPPPNPADYVRESELSIVPYIQVARDAGYGEGSIEAILRVTGDSLRRVAETEGDAFFAEMLAPAIAKGLVEPELTSDQMADLTRETDASILALYHGQQAHAWLRNVVNAIGSQLTIAGLHAATQRQPAICFLDITGYTRLTQERGDAAAANLAADLARIVQRTSVEHRGKAIKWLGDGVMFFFDEPADAVAAALEMVDAIGEAGLPPAHVGVASGEVLFQQGDYFGQTVNLAARISDFARPGEVLVSEAVVEAAGPTPTLTFHEIGPVDLKGVSGSVRLHVARRA